MPTDRITLACVVEGEGEQVALPKVLFRIAHESSVWNLYVPVPKRVPRSRLLASGGIEREVGEAAYRVTSDGGVLVVIDADDDRPGCRGPELLTRAQSARSDMPISVVLANREFEAWYLAAASSLAGSFGFPDDLTAPDNPEAIRGAKEWLSRQRAPGHPYKPTVDQAPLASAFDMKQARDGSPSFDKFCREVESLLGLST
jgi:Domain of unknown function (DUF4276)